MADINAISDITVSNLLQGYDGDDPFTQLRSLIAGELRPHVTPALRGACIAFSALFGVALLATIAALGTRLWRGDRRFYRVHDVPGHALGFIMPNVTLHWLLWNMVYLALVYPFIWLEINHVGESLYHIPICLCLVFLPMYWSVWHTAWGTAISALHFQGWQLITTEDRPVYQPPAFFRSLSPIWVNGFFITMVIACPALMAGLGAAKTAMWDQAIEVYEQLDELLAQHVGESGGATEVLDAIPEVDAYLSVMADKLWKFGGTPWQVCLSFAGLNAVIMIVACIVQSRMLLQQIRCLQRAMSAADGHHVSASSNQSAQQIKRGQMVSSLRSVTATSAVLSLSMIAYAFVCVAGLFAMTPIFHIHEDQLGHLYIVVFAYGSLDLVITALVVWQTFQKTSWRPGVTSSDRKLLKVDLRPSVDLVGLGGGPSSRDAYPSYTSRPPSGRTKSDLVSPPLSTTSSDYFASAYPTYGSAISAASPPSTKSCESTTTIIRKPAPAE